ncbi:MAG TPA: tyrosine-type recombinase/integrase [Chloroflexota bacterium]
MTRGREPRASSAKLVRLAPASIARQGRTLPELVPSFLKWFQFVRRRSDNTVRSYGEDFKTFLEFCATASPPLERPDQVDFRHIEFYMGWLQAHRGVKPQTANRHLHALRSLYQYLVREEIVTTNPAANCFMLRTQKKLPGYLTIPEQEKVLAVLAVARSLLGRRDYALVATALLTGLRCAELAALQVVHLDLEAGRLRVVNGKGGKDRELPIVPRLAAILREYLEDVRPQLVTRPLGNLRREGPGASWKLRQGKGRRGVVYRNLRTQSREEAEQRRAELLPVPPAPFVFVNAHLTGANRVRRAGQALLGRSIWHLIHRAVVPIIGRPVHPHMLRHSFAHRLYERGGDLQLIQESMGHASINTTTIYTHLTTNRQRQELARLLE